MMELGNHFLTSCTRYMMYTNIGNETDVFLNYQSIMCL